MSSVTRSLALPLFMLAALAPASCGGDEEVAPGPAGLPEGPIEIERLVPDGAEGSYDREAFLVVRDGTALDTLWIEAMDGRGSAPSVDFRKKMILAAFLGPCDGGGHTVSIGRVEREGDRLVVTVAVRRPRSRLPPDRTSPYSFVAVLRTDLPIEWRTVDGARPSSSENPRTGPDEPR